MYAYGEHRLYFFFFLNKLYIFERYKVIGVKVDL